MAITHFATVAVPADNGSNPGQTVEVTPPDNMVAGDLVLVSLFYRLNSTLSVTATDGGQTWVLSKSSGSTTYTACAWHYYCIFNGTWDANPIFTKDTAGTLALSAVMNVFRPSDGSKSWGLENSANSVVDTPSSPYDIVLQSYTVTHDSTVTVNSFVSPGAITFTLSGAGWANFGDNQYRNLQGDDLTAINAYKVLSAAGGTGDCTETESSPAGCVLVRSTFYEYTVASPNSRDGSVFTKGIMRGGFRGL